jgi:hypothetical protein
MGEKKNGDEAQDKAHCVNHRLHIHQTDCAVAVAVMMRSIITILGLSALLHSVAAYGEIFLMHT